MKVFKYVLGLILYLFVFILLYGVITNASWIAVEQYPWLSDVLGVVNTVIVSGIFLIPFWLVATPVQREYRFAVFGVTVIVLFLVYAAFFTLVFGHWLFAVSNAPLLTGVHSVIFLVCFAIKCTYTAWKAKKAA